MDKKTLDKIVLLKPVVVVGGHKNPELKDNPSYLEFTKDYLEFYDEALSSSRNNKT